MKRIILLPDFRKNTPVSNFMKIRQVRAEMFHEDVRTDRNTGITKLIVAFPNFCERA